MKALILVGGYGTRLRPLTFTVPKPLVDFCNQPMILHQIEAMVRVGVKEVVLAVNYEPEVMIRAMNDLEERFGIKITFSIEKEPLGTAGPLALAKDILTKDDSPFFVLNSDVICNFPFEELLKFHKEHGKEGTIMVTRVDDPSKFGVVVRHENTSQIARFVEKPKEFVGDEINAGIYVFNPTILKRIEARPMSIEKEVFPYMAKEGELHLLPLDGFWADVGQPKDFLKGTALNLKHYSKISPELLTTSIPHTQIVGNVLIHPTATIGKDCKLGPDVVIGKNCVVGNGVRLVNTVMMPKSTAKDNSLIKDSIIGWHSVVGRWARLCNIAVLGEDVQISDEIFVNGASVLPNKCVSSNIMEPKIVM